MSLTPARARVRTFSRAACLLLLAACAPAADDGDADPVDPGVASPASSAAAAAEAGAPQDSATVPILSGAAYRRGGAITTGRYACRDLPGEQLKGLSELGTGAPTTTRLGNQFEITGPDRYQYIGHTTQPGAFRYERRSGTLSFTSGPYASEPGEASTIRAVYGTRASDGLPTIILLFADPAYGTTFEYCVRVER